MAVVGVRGWFLNETGDPSLDMVAVEHSGVLMQRGMERVVLGAVASQLIARTPAWDELRIAGIESRNADLHGDAFTAAGSCTVKSAEEPYFVVRLDEIRQQGGDYLSALSANTRSQLRRSLREYSKRGSVTIRIAEDHTEASDYLARLGELHQIYWTSRGAAGAFATPFFNTFHGHLLAAGIPRGEIQLALIACGDQPIGYLYNFRHRGVVSNYQSGIHYTDDPHLKPGLTAHQLFIEHSLRAGDSQVRLADGRSALQEKPLDRGRPDALPDGAAKPGAFPAGKRCRGAGACLSVSLTDEPLRANRRRSSGVHELSILARQAPQLTAHLDGQ